MAQKPTPLREQTRSVVRSLLARTAIELFAAKGYDDTTLEEVAAAAGVSRRTLFNYFRNKEDLALSGLSEQGELIAARLRRAPGRRGPLDVTARGVPGARGDRHSRPSAGSR